MEIEYENKETITWCLDREGSRICLLAVRENNKLKKMKIDSEGFKLEIDGDEADSFLRVLQQIVGVKKKERHIPEVMESITSEAKNVELLSERLDETEERHAPVIEVSEPVIDEPVREEITIRSVAEDYESSEMTPTSDYKEDVRERTEVEEKLQAPEIPATSEILQILKKSEKTVDRLLMREEEPVDDKIDPLEDTASFFRHATKKSPLEELLDEEGNIKDELADNHSLKVTDDGSLHKIFKPDDLQTESFISQFAKEDPLEHFTRSDEAIEKRPVESTNTIEEKDISSTTSDTEKSGEYMTEAERRAAIEKERAERRRRLWELTRGF